MNIRPNYFNYSPNFGAHVKMREPVTELLTNVATVGSVGSTAVASSAEAAFSVAETAPNMPVSVDSGIDKTTDSFVKSAPEKLAEFNKVSLYSSTAEKGIPVQSTTAPTALVGSGSYMSNVLSDMVSEQCNPEKNDFAESHKLAYGSLGASSIASLAALGTYASSALPANSITDEQSEFICYAGTTASSLPSVISGIKEDSGDNNRKIPS